MLVNGLAQEYAKYNVIVNGLWPRTLLATAAVRNLLGGEDAIQASRHPKIMADALMYLLKTANLATSKC